MRTKKEHSSMSTEVPDKADVIGLSPLIVVATLL
jgi:hypothetical protein